MGFGCSLDWDDADTMSTISGGEANNCFSSTEGSPLLCVCESTSMYGSRCMGSRHEENLELYARLDEQALQMSLLESSACAMNAAFAKQSELLGKAQRDLKATAARLQMQECHAEMIVAQARSNIKKSDALRLAEENLRGQSSQLEFERDQLHEQIRQERENFHAQIQYEREQLQYAQQLSRDFQLSSSRDHAIHASVAPALPKPHTVCALAYRWSRSR